MDQPELRQHIVGGALREALSGSSLVTTRGACPDGLEAELLAVHASQARQKGYQDVHVQATLQAIEILACIERNLIKNASETPWLKVRRARKHLDRVLESQITSE